MSPDLSPESIIRRLDELNRKLEQKNEEKPYIIATMKDEQGMDLMVKVKTSWISAAIAFLKHTLSPFPRKGYTKVLFGDKARSYIITNLKEEFASLKKSFDHQPDQLTEAHISIMGAINTEVLQNRMTAIDDRMTTIFRTNTNQSSELTMKHAWIKFSGNITEQAKFFDDIRREVVEKNPDLSKLTTTEGLVAEFKKAHDKLDKLEKKIKDNKIRFNETTLSSYTHSITGRRESLNTKLLFQFQLIDENFKAKINQAQNFEKLNELNREYEDISNKVMVLSTTPNFEIVTSELKKQQTLSRSILRRLKLRNWSRPLKKQRR